MVNNDKCCGFLGLQFLTHKHIVTGGVQDWWCAMAKCGWWPDQIRGNYWCGFVIACLSTDHVWKTSRIISFLLMLNTPEKPWYAIGAIHFGCPWGGNMSCSFSMQRDGNKVVVFISETKRYRKFEALSLAGGINAYINDQLSRTSLFTRTWTSSWRTAKPDTCEWIVGYPGLPRILLQWRLWVTVLFFALSRHVDTIGKRHPAYSLGVFFMHHACISPSSLVQTRLEKQVGKAIRDKIMDTPFQKDFEEELKDARTWVGSLRKWWLHIASSFSLFVSGYPYHFGTERRMWIPDSIRFGGFIPSNCHFAPKFALFCARFRWNQGPPPWPPQPPGPVAARLGRRREVHLRGAQLSDGGGSAGRVLRGAAGDLSERHGLRGPRQGGGRWDGGMVGGRWGI